MLSHARFGPIEWAAVRHPRPGEAVCGDHPIVLNIGDRATLFGVVDERRSEPIRCRHLALTETHCVAMTLARAGFDTDAASWIGTGKVTAELVVRHPGSIDFATHATTIAEGLVGCYGRETGDALVLAAHHRGIP